MAIIFSRKCELGLQSVLYLASVEERDAVPAEEISNALKIPKEFISKILQELTTSGIVFSKKGKTGGFSLAKKAASIRLIDIVSAIDGDELFRKCVLGFPNCSSSAPCPAHATWTKLNEETLKMLSRETIDQFKKNVTKKVESLKER